MIFGILAAILSGALMSVQGVFNTGLSKDTGMWISAAFVQLTAFIVCMGAWFVTGRDSNFHQVLAVDDKYRLLGGVLGAFITFTVILSIQKLGAAHGIMVIVVSQLIVAWLIELFGLFGSDKMDFSWRSAIGAALTVAGVVLFKWN